MFELAEDEEGRVDDEGDGEWREHVQTRARAWHRPLAAGPLLG